ncbi:kynureninase [Comamonas endophytica]|uniref:Kynureninase n=1 Tax=Comamonas endophytica TaxID=2949090 RepID=A0ABY6G9A9_9BURK|nr:MULTISPECIES: kynureninase [unclassified Acidovorax]MCD2511551.1 kynureninase [Acidovorax sp. D4N7]UYG50935.1 kynureninase [Acidovorax sp. 5MLIR]
MTPTLQDCRERDALEPLRPLRDLFALPEGRIYLDGNSLGATPKATAARMADVVQREWSQELIASWNQAGWVDLPQRLGNQFAPWLGARQGELVFTDTTSINLFKVLSAAARIAAEDGPARRKLLTERSNFPTDLYIAESVCAQHGLELVLLEPEQILGALDDETAIVLLTHVNYRTGAMHDMEGLTAAAHARGIVCVWDLCHSAGAVPIDLHGADADFAVGCGYKYLNGGPGAPAFVWAHPRVVNRCAQPLAGWFGHAAPFRFTPGYAPAEGIDRYLCGTPPILGLSALQCGLDVFSAAELLGGMAALRAKSLALTDLFIALVEQRCAGHGLTLVTPRAHDRRGSQVCFARDGGGACAVVQALIARGVIGDFREGDGGLHQDILRFGFTPLYVGFEEVWHAVEQLRQVLESGEWREARFHQRPKVT